MSYELAYEKTTSVSGNFKFNATHELGGNGAIQLVEVSSFFAEVTLIKVNNRSKEENLEEGFIVVIKSAMEDTSCRASSRVTALQSKFAKHRREAF